MNNLYWLPESLNDAALFPLHKVLDISLFLIPMFFTMSLLWNIGKAFLYDDQIHFPKKWFIRGVLFWVLCFSYEEWMGYLSASLEQITLYIGDPKTISEQLFSLQPYRDSQYGYDSVVKQLWDTVTSFWSALWKNLAFWGIMAPVRTCLEAIRGCLIAIAYIVGPFVLAISILQPSWFRKWFTSYISFQLWSLSFVIVDSLFLHFIPELSTSQTMAANYNEGINMVLINITLMVLYLLVPLVTSFYVGSSVGAAVTGQVIALTTLGTAKLSNTGRKTAQSASGGTATSKSGKSGAGAGGGSPGGHYAGGTQQIQTQNPYRQ